MKKIEFRFDLDTLTCIEDGLPNLLDAAKQRGLHFHFYLNLGKSIDRRAMLTDKLHGKKNERHNIDIKKIAISKKLGFKNLLRTVAFNPQLIASSTGNRNLERLLAEGHRLGLHGGINHGTWLYRINSFTASQVDEIFDPAYELFCRKFGEPDGFAAPGFLTNANVKKKLVQKGFTHHGDDYGCQKSQRQDDFKLEIRPVTIIGANSVPIIEQMLACGASPIQIITEVERQVALNSYNLFYGHPCFEGLTGFDAFTRVLDALVSHD